jgi:hypothetical protein
MGGTLHVLSVYVDSQALLAAVAVALTAKITLIRKRRKVERLFKS